MVLLLPDKTLVTVSREYINFADIFHLESTAALPERTDIHNHSRDQACTATKALLPLIEEAVSCFGRRIRLTQLDLRNAHHLVMISKGNG